MNRFFVLWGGIVLLVGYTLSTIESWLDVEGFKAMALGLWTFFIGPLHVISVVSFILISKVRSRILKVLNVIYFSISIYYLFLKTLGSICAYMSMDCLDSICAYMSMHYMDVIDIISYSPIFIIWLFLGCVVGIISVGHILWNHFRDSSFDRK